MKYAWIARHKAQWPITLACEVLGVSASGYFEHWRRKDADQPIRPGANKRFSDEALLVRCLKTGVLKWRHVAPYKPPRIEKRVIRAARTA